ncbi:hypothetical protein [Nostoc favosum]|uniref:Uncharacterized protein n=1 Tax=Nostoc favosum CHAB5714 TaxID=2780399 RepID=A0ABS8INY8_9NOSO|nr:hypothetical protein [Nostoc favosum]MCC5605038.1 hypothetical protein [Nostoc favosum CHAB5714]
MSSDKKILSKALEKYGGCIAVPIQMRYNITSQGVGARQCRALTGIPHKKALTYKSQFSDNENTDRNR